MSDNPMRKTERLFDNLTRVRRRLPIYPTVDFFFDNNNLASRHTIIVDVPAEKSRRGALG